MVYKSGIDGFLVFLLSKIQYESPTNMITFLACINDFIKIIDTKFKNWNIEKIGHDYSINMGTTFPDYIHY